MSNSKISSTTSPEKALESIKAELKNGRDSIGKGEWDDLKESIEKIRQWILYLHIWRKPMPMSKVDYDTRKTDTMLMIIQDYILPQITNEYSDVNIFGYKLRYSADTQRKLDLSDSWDFLETSFNMSQIYLGGKIQEDEGVYDEYSKRNETENISEDVLRED